MVDTIDNEMPAERKLYLNELAEEFGVKPSVVYLLADTLGPIEDYDGLITELEMLGDMMDGY